MSSPWATLTLNARAHEALSQPEMTDIGNRLVDIKARVGIRGHALEGWDVQVSSWKLDADGSPVHRVRIDDQQGHLSDLIHRTIDEYERRFVFTAEELVQIRNQSGGAAA